MEKLELVNKQDLEILRGMLGRMDVPEKIIDRYLEIKRLCDRVSVPVNPSLLAMIVLEHQTGPVRVTDFTGEDTEKITKALKETPEDDELPDFSGKTETATSGPVAPPAPKSQPAPEKPKIVAPGYPKGTRVGFQYQGTFRSGIIDHCPDEDHAVVSSDGEMLELPLDCLEVEDDE